MRHVDRHLQHQQRWRRTERESVRVKTQRRKRLTSCSMSGYLPEMVDYEETGQRLRRGKVCVIRGPLRVPALRNDRETPASRTDSQTSS